MCVKKIYVLIIKIILIVSNYKIFKNKIKNKIYYTFLLHNIELVVIYLISNILV